MHWHLSSIAFFCIWLSRSESQNSVISPFYAKRIKIWIFCMNRFLDPLYNCLSHRFVRNKKYFRPVKKKQLNFGGHWVLWISKIIILFLYKKNFNYTMTCKLNLFFNAHWRLIPYNCSDIWKKPAGEPVPWNLTWSPLLFS